MRLKVRPLKYTLLAGVVVFTFSGINGYAQSSDDLFSDLLEETVSDDIVIDDTVSTSGASLQAFSGYAELSPRIFLNDRNGYHNDEQVLLTTEFEFDVSLGQNTTGYIRPRLFLDLIDSDLQRLELFEGYITYQQTHWDLRVGQFVENWGIADTFNPIDVLNRRDLSTQLLDTTRLGEVGVRARWLLDGNGMIGEPTLAFYVLPWFQRTRFALGRQRLGLGSETITFKEKQGFEPDGDEAYLYALRYQSTLNTSLFNADIQLVASRGTDRNPLIRPFNADIADTLAPVYFGNRILGAGIRAVSNIEKLAAFTFKLEIAQNNPYEFEQSPVAVMDDYLAYVAGFDWDTYNLLNNQDQLTFTLEYAGESGVSQAQSEAFPRPFSDDLITRLFWQSGDFARSSVELRGVYDQENDEHIIEATFGRSLIQWHQDLKLALSVLYIASSSEPTATFSQLPDNTSLAMTLRFDF
ncbi:hypothetical protein [Agaribacter marinus]|uniref:Uncharacterized protein n=1 Tax=Agaribacter marinus TaxID=1431249 RepID=A0AA37T4I1_9ALTE|nr:hypothetical protein [Agaribacter marinus]GLR72969.1 hypothetical protein GCM10007852_38770 [Agaribacter marinus]